jgi:hypothetical protein
VQDVIEPDQRDVVLQQAPQGARTFILTLVVGVKVLLRYFLQESNKEVAVPASVVV